MDVIIYVFAAASLVAMWQFISEKIPKDIRDFIFYIVSVGSVGTIFGKMVFEFNNHFAKERNISNMVLSFSFVVCLSLCAYGAAWVYNQLKAIHERQTKILNILNNL